MLREKKENIKTKKEDRFFQRLCFIFLRIKFDLLDLMQIIHLLLQVKEKTKSSILSFLTWTFYNVIYILFAFNILFK